MNTAAVFLSNPSFFSNPSPSFFPQNRSNLRLQTTQFPISISSSSSSSSSCWCSAGTLEPEPVDGIPNSNLNPDLDLSGGAVSSSRQRAVRIAWEKLVRWSRSWRSKAKTDVLERTNKVVVLGGGSFGTAIAAHIASKKAELEVSMLVRDVNICRSINETHFNCNYFPEHKLPENIVATTNAKAALLGADFCLHAVPVQFFFS